MIEEYTIETEIVLSDPIYTDYFSLVYGLLTVHPGYAWDGPSGIPSFLKNIYRSFFDALLYGSVSHDPGYQMIRKGYLTMEYRIILDRIFQAECLCYMRRKDIPSTSPFQTIKFKAVDWFRQFLAWIAFWVIRQFAEFAARDDRTRQVLSLTGGCDD